MRIPNDTEAADRMVRALSMFRSVGISFAELNRNLEHAAGHLRAHLQHRENFMSQPSTVQPNLWKISLLTMYINLVGKHPPEFIDAAQASVAVQEVVFKWRDDANAFGKGLQDLGMALGLPAGADVPVEVIKHITRLQATEIAYAQTGFARSLVEAFRTLGVVTDGTTPAGLMARWQELQQEVTDARAMNQRQAETIQALQKLNNDLGEMLGCKVGDDLLTVGREYISQLKHRDRKHAEQIAAIRTLLDLDGTGYTISEGIKELHLAVAEHKSWKLDPKFRVNSRECRIRWHQVGDLIGVEYAAENMVAFLDKLIDVLKTNKGAAAVANPVLHRWFTQLSEITTKQYGDGEHNVGEFLEGLHVWACEIQIVKDRQDDVLRAIVEALDLPGKTDWKDLPHGVRTLMRMCQDNARAAVSNAGRKAGISRERVVEAVERVGEAETEIRAALYRPAENFPRLSAATGHLVIARAALTSALSQGNALARPMSKPDDGDFELAMRGTTGCMPPDAVLEMHVWREKATDQQAKDARDYADGKPGAPPIVLVDTDPNALPDTAAIIPAP